MATPQQQKAEQQRTGLVACYKLTPAMLNRRVEDSDISILERIIPTFESLAPKLLGKVHQIEINVDGRSEAQKKRRMLERWQDINGYGATFDKLITAMLDAGELDQATEICKLLNPGHVTAAISGAGPDSPAPQSRLDEVPTVSDLEGLKQKDGTTLNIIEEIGSHYGSLGIQLLHDRRGTIMDGITHDHKGHVNIKRAMFEKWLGGTGMQPRTWRTLVKLLESNTIRLGILASDIRNALQ
jgi:hypothetical protein